MLQSQLANVFILFILLSLQYIFNPVRNMLKTRQDKITSDRENAEADKKEALAYEQQEYEGKTVKLPIKRQRAF